MTKYKTVAYQNAYDYFEGTEQERHDYILISAIIEIKRTIDLLGEDSPLIPIFNELLEEMRKLKNQNPYDIMEDQERSSPWLI